MKVFVQVMKMISEEEKQSNWAKLGGRVLA